MHKEIGIWFGIDNQFVGIGPDNGLVPNRRQTFIWNNDLLI